jgi:hypothetical protein
MDQPKNLHNVPTWRPGDEPRDMESGVFPVDDGPFEPVVMPRQWVRPRGAKVAPLRARTRRSW